MTINDIAKHYYIVGGIDELEKVKEEVKNLLYYWCEVNPNYVKDDVFKIIDKHISELKGK